MTIGEFTTQIAALRPQLMAAARQLTTDEATAEDMVQETLLTLWDRRTELSAHPNPAALATTMVRHKCIDHRRRMMAEQRALHHMSAEALRSAPEALPDDAELLATLIDRLPPLQSRIFRMKELEGYGKEEIMQITGCTDEALRQNLSRARRRIREEYVRQTRIPPRQRLRWAGIAATIVTIVTMVLARQQSTAFYAVIDGRRTSNAAVVAEEAELALQIIGADEDDALDALKLMN